MKRKRVGVIGYGNLGRTFVGLLDRKRETLRAEGLDLVLTCVLGRGGGVHDAGGLDPAELIEAAARSPRLADAPGFDPSFTLRRMLDDGLADIAVEFTPTNKETGEPGLTHIRECLKAGLHVATGNKGPVLVAWEELSALARQRGLLLGISCTTGGALPTILNGRDAMAGSTILSMEGVLNGTCNFILDRMERDGLAYDEALQAAQAAGIAEANPAMDVEGWDTAVKLLILVRAVMGVSLRLDGIPVRGVAGVTAEDVRRAQEAGTRIKLVGRAWREGDAVRAEVAPMVLGPENPLYGISGKNKAVRYVSDTMGELFVSGGASDPTAAAAASLRDIVNACRSGLIQ